MGLRGPAPKPTELRRFEGNPSRRPLPPKEPVYQPGLPAKPRRISIAAAKVWDALVDEMAGAAVLRRVDAHALWHLCEDEAILGAIYPGIWDMVRKLEKKARAEGEDLPSGAMIALLNMDIGSRAMRHLRDLAGRTIIERREFGLTPSSRSRIETVGDGTAIDALERKLCG